MDLTVSSGKFLLNPNQFIDNETRYMPIRAIHVGCGSFSVQRLQLIIDGGKFVPVACVDIDLENGRRGLTSLPGGIPEDLDGRIYTTITEARKKNNADVCFIYVGSEEHANLIIESLEMGMHTFCVKTIACNQHDFKRVINVYKKHSELMLVQGLNNQWNEAASKMREWIQDEGGIGTMLGGECICWGRQNMKGQAAQTDVTIEGMYFHALACHQLSQLVAAKGLPEFVTACVHARADRDLNFRGVWGTSGGQCLFEFADGTPFSYTGTRAAHGNPFGFASRWSGQWTIHGENGDIRREGGHLTLFRNGGPVEDYYLKDVDSGLLEDERIQFDVLHKALTTGENQEWLQQCSLDTWILMEACNVSARKRTRVSVSKLKEYLMENGNG